MMVQYIYIIVRFAVIFWALFRLWHWLHHGPITKLWAKIPVRSPKPEPEPEPEPEKISLPRKAKKSVVGVTHAIILEDPRSATPPVVASEELEQTGYIGKDEDISAEDIETDYQPAEMPPKPSDDELYGDEGAYAPDPALSSGMSFEQIGDAVNVLTTEGADEQRMARTAKTVYDLQNTPIYEFMTKEVCSAERLENLVKSFIDDQGEIIVKKVDNLEDVRLRNFDISIYT